MKIFTQNIGAKIFALLCAVFLWAYVSAGESRVGYFPGNLPLEAKNTPEGLAAIYDIQKIKVKIQAPYETWNKLSAENFSAYIDLSGLSEGTYDTEVKVSVNMSNVSIVEKEPSRVIVRIEPVTKKVVPVRVRFDRDAKTGFVPGETIVKPDTAQAIGAKSLVESLGEATALIKLSGEGEDFKKTVVLAAYNEEGDKIEGLLFDPKTVDVLVKIVPASEGKTVGIKAKTRGKPKSDYFVSKIETSPATIEIFGSASGIKSILYLETKEINIEGLDKDIEKEAELSVPSGITISDIKVKVKIYLSQNLSSKEITASLNYLNLGAGLSVTSLSPSSVRAVVSCPSAILNSLNSNQVVINMNLQGKGGGSYFMVITKDMFSVPDNCAVSSWLPSAVTVGVQ